MRLQELAQALDLKELTPHIGDEADSEITRGYASDLLERCAGPCLPAGGVLVTLTGTSQRHRGGKSRRPAGGHLLVRAGPRRRRDREGGR